MRGRGGVAAPSYSIFGFVSGVLRWRKGKHKMNVQVEYSSKKKSDFDYEARLLVNAAIRLAIKEGKLPPEAVKFLKDPKRGLTFAVLPAHNGVPADTQ